MRGSARSRVPDDRYTLPRSGGVLRNLLGITDADDLDEATNAYVSAEWANLQTEELPSRFDADYLGRIHCQLFRKVFSWAGEVRDVELMAAGTSLVYCPADLVDEQLVGLFSDLSDNNYLRELDALAFASRLAKTWGRLTYIHPFRDGNTRSQSFFFSRLAESAGHPIDWERIDPDDLRRQRLAASQGHPEALQFYIEDRLVAPPSHW